VFGVIGGNTGRMKVEALSCPLFPGQAWAEGKKEQLTSQM
jgi:hypothetical protein